MTTAECVTVLKGYPKRLPAAIRRGMRRGLVKTAVDAQRIAAQNGIMRSLLGGNTFGPIVGAKWKSPGKGLIRVKSPRVLPNGSVWGGLEAVGIAALQELGGRTIPHAIKLKGIKAGTAKGALTLKGFVKPFAASVKHPGGRVTRHPFLEEAFRRNQGLILREIDIALGEEAQKLGAAA